MSDIEWGAVAKGAVPGTVLAFAFVLLRTATDATGALAGVLTLCTLGAFAAAGVIATNAAGLPRVATGAVAALAASLVVGLVGIPIRLARRTDTTLAGQLVTLPLFCLLAMSCGIVGAYVAVTRANRTQPPGGTPS